MLDPCLYITIIWNSKKLQKIFIENIASLLVFCLCSIISCLLQKATDKLDYSKQCHDVVPLNMTKPWNFSLSWITNSLGKYITLQHHPKLTLSQYLFIPWNKNRNEIYKYTVARSFWVISFSILHFCINFPTSRDTVLSI